VKVYTRNVPSIDHNTEADVVACWERNIEAEFGVRGLSPGGHQVVFALDLLQLERLCVLVPGTENEPSRHTVGARGVTWLRRLTELGFNFVWGPEYIRLANEDAEMISGTVKP
jgi:hypothetical protein